MSLWSMHMPEGMPKPERSIFTVQVLIRMEVPVVVSRKEAAISPISCLVSGSMWNWRAAVRMCG